MNFSRFQSGTQTPYFLSSCTDVVAFCKCNIQVHLFSVISVFPSCTTLPRLQRDFVKQVCNIISSLEAGEVKGEVELGPRFDRLLDGTAPGAYFSYLSHQIFSRPWQKEPFLFAVWTNFRQSLRFVVSSGLGTWGTMQAEPCLLQTDGHMHNTIHGECLGAWEKTDPRYRSRVRRSFRIGHYLKERMDVCREREGANLFKSRRIFSFPVPSSFPCVHSCFSRQWIYYPRFFRWGCWTYRR